MKVKNQTSFNITVLVYDKMSKRIITQLNCGIGQKEVIGIPDAHLLNPDTFDELVITAYEGFNQDESYHQVRKEKPAKINGICNSNIIFLMYYCEDEISDLL